MDAFYGARSHRFFNAIFRAAFGKNDFGLFFIFVKCKDLLTKLDTTLTANAFVSIYDNPSCHFITFFYIFMYTFPLMNANI